jgi:hypothetical protein
MNMRKKMNRKIVLTSLIALLIAAPAFAADFGDGGAALQGVLDGLTISAPGSSSINVATDMVQPDVDADSYWAIGGSGGSIATVVVELASYAGTNTFGVYDAANPANYVQLFDGSASAGTQSLMSILADGTVRLNFADTGIDFAGNNFGFYLDSPQGGGRYYSDTSLNELDDAGVLVDHMHAYQGVGDTIEIPPFAAGPWTANEYILGWEDVLGGGDKDHTDFVVLVESVNPVPAPAAVWLGLLGLGAAGLRLRKRRA